MMLRDVGLPWHPAVREPRLAQRRANLGHQPYQHQPYQHQPYQCTYRSDFR
jgi:hypothetical protein